MPVWTLKHKLSPQTATWDFVNVSDTDTIVFDIIDLDISQVTLDNGKETGYKIGQSKPHMGAPLYVAIAPENQISKYYLYQLT